MCFWDSTGVKALVVIFVFTGLKVLCCLTEDLVDFRPIQWVYLVDWKSLRVQIAINCSLSYALFSMFIVLSISFHVHLCYADSVTLTFENIASQCDVAADTATMNSFTTSLLGQRLPSARERLPFVFEGLYIINFIIVVGGAGWDNQQSMASGVGSPWLLLRNIPPQVEGNTLKTLCSQHGPLQSFFVNTNSCQALIKYSTKEEGLKAQKSLNSCVMYEMTIGAEFVNDSEVHNYR